MPELLNAVLISGKQWVIQEICSQKQEADWLAHGLPFANHRFWDSLLALIISTTF